MNRQHQINFWYLVGAVVAIVLLQGWWAEYQRVDHIPYSEFRSLLESGKVGEVVVGDTTIRGRLIAAEPNRKQEFVTNKVDPNVADLLARHNVRFAGERDSTFLSAILSWIVPVLLFAGIWMLAIRRMGEGAGGLLAIGRSKARVYLEKRTDVTFADVAGVDEAKDELKEIVDFLRDPQKHGRLGARLPKGVLLIGPPGTGKTLLARAVAGEAGVPFFTIGGSEFVEMFVGVGAARVRDLFEQARRHAPCIIFIDELDALGRARGTFGLGGHDEKEQTLNQLLAELDGFDSRAGIVLLAATNRPEILDPALLRAGRFDRQVLVDRPDRKGRVDILAVHLRKVKLAADVDIDRVAALTPGFTGADLANLVNEAALVATRREAPEVVYDDFVQAVERIVAGLEKKRRVLIEHERRIIAVHEVGHALVAMALPGTDPVQKISIIPRGIGALGYTLQRPVEDRFLLDRGELEARLAVLLGGRAAESLVFASVSTGAADDLEKATEIARSMATRFGMAPELGQVTYELAGNPNLPTVPDSLRPSPRYSEETAARIDAAIQEIISTAFQRAQGVLAANRTLLDEGAGKLLARETLAGHALTDMAARVQREALARVA